MQYLIVEYSSVHSTGKRMTSCRFSSKANMESLPIWVILKFHFSYQIY